MSNEIPTVTVEEIREALRKSAAGADELNKQLKDVFGVGSDLILRAINSEYSRGFDDGREYARAELAVIKP